MTAARGSFTLTLLANGRVLAAGGINGANNPMGSAEVFDPSTGTWTATGEMITARDEHTAVLLATGNVIVAGCENAASVTTTKTELYNPSTGKWTASGKPEHQPPRAYGHTIRRWQSTDCWWKQCHQQCHHRAGERRAL